MYVATSPVLHKRDDGIHLIAIDIGADSGRVVLGKFYSGTMRMDIVHRFPNIPLHDANGLHWNIPALWEGIRQGVRVARRLSNGPIASIGIATWGVDYCLVDGMGNLLESPWNYRDRRTAGMIEIANGIMSETERFSRTGTRDMPFNTIFQLLAAKQTAPEVLKRSFRLLTISDFFSARLCGRLTNEWTNAATTGLTRAGTPEWDMDLIAGLDLPKHLFGDIVKSGTDLGVLRDELAIDFGFEEERPRIIAPGCHDTASAVAAMPSGAPGTAFISCGTWSLMGIVTDRARCDEMAFSSLFTNEIAVDGRIRLLRNIMGLWVWQECRRDLAAEGVALGHDELARLATDAAPSARTFDIDHPDLLAPSSVGERMIDRVRRIADDLPTSTIGELFRRITEGLAAAYALCRRDLEHVTGSEVKAISLMGGGCHNRLLCQLTADMCGVPVISGPVEGTALGNLLVQAKGLGIIDLAASPKIVTASSEIHRYSRIP